MTAAAITLRSRLPRARRRILSLAPVARLLRLEFRRNAVTWLLPLLAAVFWVDTYRDSMSVFSVWGLRESLLPDHIVKDFAGFSAGVAAWMGSREGRRAAVDLVRVTARPSWLRRSVTLAATAGWMLAAYACCIAVLYGVTAGQGAWGSPAWWPVALGAAAVTATCAIGFTAGAFFPGRFTAPLAAVGVEVLMLAGTSLSSVSLYARLTPGTVNLTPDTGAYYPHLPDQAINQVIFLGGITIALAGVTGLAATGGGRTLRGMAAVVTVVGLAAVGTAAGLARTAQAGVDGWIIPALHDAADDRPVTYTPVCGTGPVPICVNPAFRGYLPALSSTLAPAFREMAGLPGAPVRAVEISGYAAPAAGARLSGSPVVLSFAMPALGPHGFPGVQRPVLVAFITGNADHDGTAAQQAVWLALVEQTGFQPDISFYSPAVRTAAARFAALPAVAQHAWLAARLPALRAGHITLEQIP
ncbi:MAG TPA: hypothetical protein VF070_24500 [Streptosporangiaceae bacterium]